MSMEHFENGCDGCRPVLIDPESKTSLPDDHPLMQAVLNVYNAASLEEKEAFHNLTCLNSRDPSVMTHVSALSRRFQDAMQKATQPNA